MSDFKTFMDLTDAGLAMEYAAILDGHQIPYKLQDTSRDFDASMSFNKATKTFILMLHPNDFEQANSLFELKSAFDMEQINASHPFFAFSTSELSDVVMNYDEWNPLDVRLAKHLLKKENIEIVNSEINAHQKNKKFNQTLDGGNAKSDTMIITGYVFCLLGGLLGFAIGLFLITAKKQLPDGSKTYVYKKSQRDHGYLMVLIGLAFSTLYLYLKLKK